MKKIKKECPKKILINNSKIYITIFKKKFCCYYFKFLQFYMILKYFKYLPRMEAKNFFDGY